MTYLLNTNPTKIRENPSNPRHPRSNHPKTAPATSRQERTQSDTPYKSYSTLPNTALEKYFYDSTHSENREKTVA